MFSIFYVPGKMGKSLCSKDSLPFGGFKGNSCSEASLGSNYFTSTWINLPDLSVCFTISHSAGIFSAGRVAVLYLGARWRQAIVWLPQNMSSEPHKNTAFAIKSDEMRNIGIFLFACFVLFRESVDLHQTNRSTGGSDPVFLRPSLKQKWAWAAHSRDIPVLCH